VELLGNNPSTILPFIRHGKVTGYFVPVSMFKEDDDE
jgi:hypothetical protein